MRRMLEISVAALLSALPVVARSAPPAAPVAAPAATPPAGPPAGPSAAPAAAPVTVPGGALLPVAALPARPVSGGLTLDTGTGHVLRLAAPAANVFVADPRVAEVHPAGPSTLFVFGVGPGRTTIAALGQGGQLIGAYNVTVLPSNFGAHAAQQAIDRMVPGGHVRVQAQPGGLLLTGWVESPAAAARAAAIAGGFLDGKQKLEDQITVRGSVQVTLQVRIVQMQRSVSDKLGVNWQALGNIGTIGKLPALGAMLNGGVAALGSTVAPGLAFTAALDALASDGLVRILAEPNLTVISGQKANFLVGGEDPIPVPGQNGQVTIEYKKFGVSLSFLPTVYSDGRINIHVAPEVSQPIAQSAVVIPAANQTFQVPSFSVSRAETTVQLGSGQSFAIGGLLQDVINDGASGIPNISSIPVLGALFRDDNFNRQQTELVIIITPYIVRPVDSPRVLQTPDENYTAPSDLQRLLFMRQVGTPHHWAPVPVPGHAGFMVQ